MRNYIKTIYIAPEADSIDNQSTQQLMREIARCTCATLITNTVSAVMSKHPHNFHKYVN